MKLHDTYDERTTKIMMRKPVTELSRFIGSKWFLTLDKLAERTGVSLGVITAAVEDKPIRPWNEAKIRRYLDNYKGEV